MSADTNQEQATVVTGVQLNKDGGRDASFAIPDPMPALLDAKQVAQFLHISWRQAERLAKSGALPAVKVGKLWRFPSKQILKFAGIED